MKVVVRTVLLAVVVVLLVLCVAQVCMARRTPPLPPVYVSMTTIPTRLNGTLVSRLQKLHLPPDITGVVLNIPVTFARTGEAYPDPPSALFHLPKVIVNRCKDWGPATKLIPTAQWLRHRDALIITLDDDIDYHPRVLDHLLREYRRHGAQPHTVLANTFRPLRHPDGRPIRGLPHSHILEGWNGVLYPSRIFGLPGLLSAVERAVSSPTCRNHDDVVLSCLLVRRGDVQVARTQSPYPADVRFSSRDPNGLMQLTNRAAQDFSGYEQCASMLDA